MNKMLWAIKLQHAGNDHIGYMQSRADELEENGPDNLDDAGKLLIDDIKEHKKTCPGCSETTMTKIREEIERKKLEQLEKKRAKLP